MVFGAWVIGDVAAGGVVGFGFVGSVPGFADDGEMVVVFADGGTGVVVRSLGVVVRSLGAVVGSVAGVVLLLRPTPHMITGTQKGWQNNDIYQSLLIPVLYIV